MPHIRLRGRCARSVGDETPLPPETLGALYDDAEGYLREFTSALDATIRSGFLLADDRSALLRDAEARARDAFAKVPARKVSTR